jgi:hypothetical protein
MGDVHRMTDGVEVVRTQDVVAGALYEVRKDGRHISGAYLLASFAEARMWAEGYITARRAMQAEIDAVKRVAQAEVCRLRETISVLESDDPLALPPFASRPAEIVSVRAAPTHIDVVEEDPEP